MRTPEPVIESLARTRRLAALLLLAMALPAAAQDALDPIAVPDFPRYTVELIVFAYDESAWSGGEIFVPDVPPAYAAGRDEGAAVPVFSDRPEDLLRPAPAAPAAQPEAEHAELTGLAEDEDAQMAGFVEDDEISGFDGDLGDVPLRARIELTLLPPEAWTLNNVYDELARIDAYRPLMHVAWTQTTPPEATAPAIRLRALGNPPPGLSGTVTLYQGRFVHLGLDLTLDTNAAAALAGGAYDPGRSATDRAIAGSGLAGGAGEQAAGSTVPAYGDPASGPGGMPALPVRYHISEVRIMHDGAIRYYDHPRFGVIAKLTEVKQDDPTTASPAGNRASP